MNKFKSLLTGMYEEINKSAPYSFTCLKCNCNFESNSHNLYCDTCIGEYNKGEATTN